MSVSLTPQSTDRERLIVASRQARARWSLLQALADGQSCLNPGQYQTDCGKCVICAFKYVDGAERLLENYGPQAGIPGAPDNWKLRNDLYEGLGIKTDRRGRIVRS